MERTDLMGMRWGSKQYRMRVHVNSLEISMAILQNFSRKQNGSKRASLNDGYGHLGFISATYTRSVKQCKNTDIVGILREDRTFSLGPLEYLGPLEISADADSRDGWMWCDALLFSLFFPRVSATLSYKTAPHLGSH